MNLQIGQPRDVCPEGGRDKSVVHRPLLAKFYSQDVPDGPITEIPYCGPRPGWTNKQKFASKLLTAWGYGPHSDYAVPAPCINARMLEGDGDLTIEVLLLGEDPKIGYK